MITAGSVDWSCIWNSSRLSTDDNVTAFEEGYRSTLKSSLASPTTIVDRVEGPLVNETFELRLFPSVLTAELTPFLLFTKGTDEVLQKIKTDKNVSTNRSGLTNITNKPRTHAMTRGE